MEDPVFRRNYRAAMESFKGQAKATAPAAGTEADKRYIIKALHPARAHDREELAMLAHEAWLAKRMQSSRVADNLVQIHTDLPGLPEGRPGHPRRTPR